MINNIALRLTMIFFLFVLTSPITVASANVEGQIQQLSNTIGQQMGRFSQGMQQWRTGTMSDDAAVLLLKTSLVPLARQLTSNYHQLNNLGKRLANKQQSKQVSYISGQGSVIFNEWNQVLSKMLQLNQQNNRLALQRFAKQRIPLISQRTVQFLQMVSQATGVNTYHQNTNTQANLLQQQAMIQAQQQHIQMMSNISRMGHETSMAIINNMAGSTVDHYENGLYVGNW